MNSSEENGCKVSEEKACSAFLLKRWRRQLLIDEAEGDADAIELDRRVLDYYLDQYHPVATAHQADRGASIEGVSTANRPEQSLKRGE